MMASRLCFLRWTMTMDTVTTSEKSLPSSRIAVACAYCFKSTVSLGKNDKLNGHRRTPAPGNLATSPPPPPPPLPISPTASTKSASAIPDKCSCGKPRLRCTFCLSRLNTSSALQMFQPSFKVDKSDEGQRVTKSIPHPKAAFTVFCVTCRHSGHALHYLNWFQNNSTCPVSGCTCTCASLDSKIGRNSNWLAWCFDSTLAQSHWDLHLYYNIAIVQTLPLFPLDSSIYPH